MVEVGILPPPLNTTTPLAKFALAIMSLTAVTVANKSVLALAGLSVAESKFAVDIVVPVGNAMIKFLYIIYLRLKNVVRNTEIKRTIPKSQ
jgi:hypothetical protein